jgi:hypothetical protein
MWYAGVDSLVGVEPGKDSRDVESGTGFTASEKTFKSCKRNQITRPDPYHRDGERAISGAFVG